LASSAPATSANVTPVLAPTNRRARLLPNDSAWFPCAGARRSSQNTAAASRSNGATSATTPSQPAAGDGGA
jgi:hypothetical protein